MNLVFKKVYSAYKPHKYDGESFDQKDSVERDGYVSKERRIQMMIDAGERLADWKRQVFAEPPSIEEAEPLPWLAKDFDLIDLKSMTEVVKERQKRAWEAKQAEIRAKEAKAKSEANEGAPTTPRSEPANQEPV